VEVSVPGLVDLTGPGALAAVGLSAADVAADSHMACSRSEELRPGSSAGGYSYQAPVTPVGGVAPERHVAGGGRSARRREGPVPHPDGGGQAGPARVGADVIAATPAAAPVPVYSLAEAVLASPATQAVAGPPAPKPPAAAAAGPFSAGAVLALVLGSSVVGALLTALSKNLRDAAVVRRDKYAAAVGHLAAWTEYPYRIRRRTSDDAEVLTRLADLGHQLQIDSACHGGWIAGESQPVGDLYGRWLDHVQAAVAEPASRAWTEGPVTRAAGMVLDGFGPSSAAPAIAALEAAIAYRFGLRRLLWPRFVARRLRGRSLYPSDRLN